MVTFSRSQELALKLSTSDTDNTFAALMLLTVEFSLSRLDEEQEEFFVCEMNSAPLSLGVDGWLLLTVLLKLETLYLNTIPHLTYMLTVEAGFPLIDTVNVIG